MRYMLGEKYITAIGNLARSDNAKTVLIPADIQETLRGILGRKVHINSESGKLGDTDFAVTDRAASICPVGVILRKRVGFAVPIGERTYDKAPASVVEVAK